MYFSMYANTLFVRKNSEKNISNAFYPIKVQQIIVKLDSMHNVFLQGFINLNTKLLHKMQRQINIDTEAIQIPITHLRCASRYLK